MIETETDNVYKRYLSERSQAESPVINYRKSPNQDESSLNIYSQSYRSQNDRRLSNPGEYLYQRALEKKENRQQQIEKRQKEKEIMELSACTFTPNLRPLDTSEDFETRSRNWQNQKEKRLDEIQVRKNSIWSVMFMGNRNTIWKRRWRSVRSIQVHQGKLGQ